MSPARRRVDDNPAQTGLFDLDDPTIVDNSPEARLMARVAAQTPPDAVLWPADGAAPAVAVNMVAHGTYGQVTGLAPNRTLTTAQGYVVRANAVRGGIGGWPGRDHRGCGCRSRSRSSLPVAVLGPTVSLVAGSHNELWAVQGCPEQIEGQVACGFDGDRRRPWSIAAIWPGGRERAAYL